MLNMEDIRDVYTSGIYATNKLLNILTRRKTKYIKYDGGRGDVKADNDCVTRAISVALGKPYKETYDELYRVKKRAHKKQPYDYPNTSPKDGVALDLYDNYLKKEHNLEFDFNSGVTLEHLNLRKGTYLCVEVYTNQSGHTFVVKDGIIYDTFDNHGNVPLYAHVRVA